MVLKRPFKTALHKVCVNLLKGGNGSSSYSVVLLLLLSVGASSIWPLNCRSFNKSFPPLSLTASTAAAPLKPNMNVLPAFLEGIKNAWTRNKSLILRTGNSYHTVELTNLKACLVTARCILPNSNYCLRNSCYSTFITGMSRGVGNSAIGKKRCLQCANGEFWPLTT